MIRFYFHSGPLREKLINEEEGPITIGRSPDNRLQILNEKVSRNHCIIRREGTQFFIKDLGTTNGTFVNGAPVKEKEIFFRDTLRVGDVAFTFMAENDNYVPPPVPDTGVFEKMRKSKGYDTIFAETMGEAKKRDYFKILENKPPNVDTTFYLKKSFKNLGYTASEAENLIREATGHRADSFPANMLVDVQTPKYNELMIKTRKKIADIQISQLVRFNDADYLVMEINEDPGDGTCQYRLKMC